MPNALNYLLHVERMSYPLHFALFALSFNFKHSASFPVIRAVNLVCKSRNPSIH